MPFHRLSIENIRCTAPCPVEQASESMFVFHTKANVLYSVSFKEDMEIAGLQTYQFIIERISDKQGYDTEVKDTIVAIVREFFSQNNEILLYICDTQDGREAARNRLFLKWFKESDDEGLYEIKAADANVEGEGLFFAIIYKKSSAKYEEITREFDDVAAYLTAK